MQYSRANTIQNLLINQVFVFVLKLLTVLTIFDSLDSFDSLVMKTENIYCTFFLFLAHILKVNTYIELLKISMVMFSFLWYICHIKDFGIAYISTNSLHAIKFECKPILL